jgi:hypothetical protein
LHARTLRIRSRSFCDILAVFPSRTRRHRCQSSPLRLGPSLSRWRLLEVRAGRGEDRDEALDERE